MTDIEILAELNAIVRDVLNDDSIALMPESQAGDIDGWDSFKHISIVVAAETRFGVRFLTSEVEELRNMADFVDLIGSKLKNSKVG